MKWIKLEKDNVPDDRYVLGYFGCLEIKTVEFEVFDGELYCWVIDGELSISLPSHWASIENVPSEEELCGGCLTT